MRVQQQHAIRAWQPRQAVVALHQLVRPLAIGRPRFGHCLIKSRGRAPAAVPKQDDPGHPLLLQVLHSLLHIERNLFKFHQRLVVHEPRVQTENREAAPRQFRAFRRGKFIAGAVDRQYADAWREVVVWPIKQGLGASLQRDEDGIALRAGRRNPKCKSNAERQYRPQPSGNSHTISSFPVRYRSCE